MELITITAATIMSLFTSIAGTSNSDNRFAYNAEMQDGKVSAIVTYDNNGKYLTAKTRKQYTYDNLDRVVKKEVMRWNSEKHEWENYQCMCYTYNADNTVLDMMTWNSSKKAYEQSQRMTYSSISQNATGVDCYTWNKSSNMYELNDNYVLLSDYTANLLADMK